MKRPIFTSFTLLSSTLLLSACTLTGSANMPVVAPQTEVGTVKNATPTPTLGGDNSVKTIETDLKATSVLDEDFSDIK